MSSRTDVLSRRVFAISTACPGATASPPRVAVNPRRSPTNNVLIWNKNRIWYIGSAGLSGAECSHGDRGNRSVGEPRGKPERPRSPGASIGKWVHRFWYAGRSHERRSPTSGRAASAAQEKPARRSGSTSAQRSDPAQSTGNDFAVNAFHRIRRTRRSRPTSSRRILAGIGQAKR